MNTAVKTIPTGTLKQVTIKDIKVGPRFRKDFTGLDLLVESIRDKGVLQPITLSPDLTLLAGERRLRAATLAGLDKIPALIRKIDGEIDAREIELIENTFRADFTWQEKTNSIAEIDRLYKERNFDWSGRKTAQLINKSSTDVARTLELARAVAAIPELGEQATAHDAYKMLKRFEEDVIVEELRRRQDAQLNPDAASSGEHIAFFNKGRLDYTPDLKARLRIADSNYFIQDTFLGLTELRSEGVVHLIECDPPYGIDLPSTKGSKDTPGSNVLNYEEIPADKYDTFLNNLATELYRVAGRDCWLVFWFGPTWHTEVKRALKAAKWIVDDIPAIWVKTQGQTLQPELYLARCYEPFFLARKGNPFMAKRGRSNVFQFSGTPAAQKYHPTERPLPLVEEILNTIASPRQVVLVPFLGSGATLRACYKQGMDGFGFDINPSYKDRFMLAVEEDVRMLETPEVEDANP